MKEQTVIGFVLPVHQPLDGPSPDSGDPTATRRSLPLSAFQTESQSYKRRDETRYRTNGYLFGRTASTSENINSAGEEKDVGREG
jgi:hypothetical protein